MGRFEAIRVLTAFWGLVSGVQTVELEVAPEVAVVEVRLDQDVVATLDRPPWRFDGDFGEGLRAHELEAIAFDDAGRELGRVRRWINASDGTELGATDRTVIAIETVRDRALTVDEMQDWFVDAAGQALRVLRVDKGPAELVVVRDPATQVYLELLANRQKADPATRALRFEADTRVRFLSPLAAPPSKIRGMRHFFSASPSLPLERGLLAHVDRYDDGPTARIIDAVALAGMELQAGAQRRAVLLLAAAKSVDDSFFTARQARAYLRDLQVPSVLLSFGPARDWAVWDPSYTIELPPKSFGWNGGEALAAAVRDLRAQLARQRIVVLSGRHLPQDIHLRSDVEGVRLAGSLSGRGES